MIPFCYWGDNMTEEKVQMVIRLTEAEREQVKVLASKENKSMNQYVLDKVLAENDSKEGDDDMTINVLSKQLAVKDSQIKELQKLLNQQQQLSLSDKAELQKLQLKLHDNTLEPSKEQKKTFWQRVFNL